MELSELLQEKTKEDLRALLMLALKGIGFVAKVGYGTGSLAVSGVATDTKDVRIKVVTAGELGVAQVQVSYDDGTTYGSTTTLAGSGTLALSYGATAQFSNGSAADSFAVGDEYSFSLSTPTFPVTAWQTASVPLTLLELDAEAMSSFSKLQVKIAGGGYLTLAENAWLDLWVEQLYKLSRELGTATEGVVYLEDPSGAGPFTIAVGQVWLGTPGGRKYYNTTGGTLPLGGTILGGTALALNVRADRVGTQHNVGNGAITELFTSLPGVVVSNPDPGSGSWMTSPGTNRETDAELKLRASSRWPALGIGATSDGYAYWVSGVPTYGPLVTRTLVRNHPTEPGTVQLYLATAAGIADSDIVDAVDEYLQPRVPFSSTLDVASAVAQAHTVEATVYCAPGYSASVADAVAQNLAALNGGGLNSDGQELPGVDIGGTLYLTAIVEELMRPPGVRNAVVASPLADVAAIDSTRVLVLTQNITVVEVP